MNKNRILDPQSLDLFHGTIGLVGAKINIQSGTGVGWNSMTLGNAFYTSLRVEAACLFSHLLLQKSILKGEERFENLGFAKIYKISLNKNFSILDADQSLDASRVRSILLRAGVSERYLRFRNDDQLTDFHKSADLLCYGIDLQGNRNEYLTKALGYDGLLIKERAWEGWDYFPTDIGIDLDELNTMKVCPPKTLAIYNVNAIDNYALHRDGILHSFSKEKSDMHR